MTGGDRIPDELPLSTSGLDVKRLEGFSGASKVRIVPGSLSSRLHKTVIGSKDTPYSTNCNTDTGVWKLDKRYRQCQPSPNSTNTVRAFGYGLSYTDGDYYTMIQGTSVYDLQAGWVDSGDTLWGGSFNGATTHWGTALGQTVAAEDWYSWEHKGYIFFASDTTGSVRYKKVGGNPLEILYKQYEFGPPVPSTGAVVRPPYYSRNWVSGDTRSQPAATQSTYYDYVGTSVSGGIMQVQYTGVFSNVGECRVKITLGSTYDASNSNYIGLHIKASGIQFMEWQKSWQGLSIHDSGGTTSTATMTKVGWRAMTVNGVNDEFFIVFDISAVANSAKDAIDYLTFTWGMSGQGVVLLNFQPLVFGGVFYHDMHPSGGIIGKSDQDDVEYAYTYDGQVSSGGTSTTAESDGYKIDIDGKLSMGLDFTNPVGATPKWLLPFDTKLFKGAWNKLTIPLGTGGSPGYGAGDKINIYRLTKSARGITQWQRLTRLNNTGTPTYTDYLPDSTVQGDTGTYPVKTPMTIGTVSPSTSGEVVNIICGCSWRGSNVYFSTDGKAYFSMQGNFKKVLWEGIIYEIDPDDMSRPRTLTVSDTANDAIITAVANDALYMFSRRSVYAMTGDVPSQAGNPRRMPTLHGALSKRAAHQYQNGVVYASDTGLFYIAVGSIYTGKPGEAHVEELTKDVSSTWTRLLGSTVADRLSTVVVCYDNEIYVFCKNRYMRLTKYGSWVYGEYQSGHDVYAAVSDPRRGVVAALTTGKVINVGDYITDLGTTAAGDAGTAPTWSYYTKRFVEPVNLMRAICNYEASSGTPSLSITAYTSRNLTPNALSFTTLNRIGFDNFVGKETNGNWFELYISGTNKTSLNSLELEVSTYQEGGNT